MNHFPSKWQHISAPTFVLSVIIASGCAGNAPAPQSAALPMAGSLRATQALSGQPIQYRQFEGGARCALGKITIFQGPSGGVGAVNIASGLSNDVWFGELGINAIVKMNKRGSATAYTIPTANAVPEGIAMGPNQQMWFTEWNQAKIGSVTATGTFQEFALKLQPGQTQSNAVTMIQGPDKRMWFGTDADGIAAHKVGGKTVFYDTQINSEQIIGLTTGPDGNIWYTTSNGPHIGKMTRSGVPTNYNVGAAGGFQPSAGPDGRIWFADAANTRIGAINTNGSGLTYYNTGLTGQPFAITKAPDGNLYFVEALAQKVGRITTAGVITECSITAPQPFISIGITIGPDGKVWFVDNQHDQVGKLAIP